MEVQVDEATFRKQKETLQNLPTTHQSWNTVITTDCQFVTVWEYQVRDLDLDQGK